MHLAHPFPGPPSTRLLPLWRLHCFHTVYHEDRNSVLGTDRSEQENVGDEKGFQIHIQSQQSWQLVTLSVFLASFLWFPGVAALIRLHNMQRLLRDLAQDQSWSPNDYPAEWTLFNFLWGGESGCFHCLLCIFDSGSKWWTHVSYLVTTRPMKSPGSSSLSSRWRVEIQIGVLREPGDA